MLWSTSLKQSQRNTRPSSLIVRWPRHSSNSQPMSTSTPRIASMLLEYLKLCPLTRTRCNIRKTTPCNCLRCSNQNGTPNKAIKDFEPHTRADRQPLKERKFSTRRDCYGFAAPYLTWPPRRMRTGISEPMQMQKRNLSGPVTDGWRRGASWITHYTAENSKELLANYGDYLVQKLHVIRADLKVAAKSGVPSKVSTYSILII